ncbi:MAG TPA: DUF2948 family protein [Dongiaceae bacterium]|jgi:hypothetical protein|nr:DUF2948 family protein [Dongiaceae bacterium]
MTPLKIVARDAEDLKVVSACLQDALVPPGEMRHLPEERRFIMVANRFRWERVAAPSPVPAPGQDAAFEADEDFGNLQRVNTGICIDRVLSVRSRGIDRSRPDNFLSILSLRLDGTRLSVLFAGGGEIQMEIESLALYLSDLGKAWPTQWQPDHAVEPAGKKASGR